MTLDHHVSSLSFSLFICRLCITNAGVGWGVEEREDQGSNPRGAVPATGNTKQVS